jgi:hypothetical protein
MGFITSIEWTSRWGTIKFALKDVDVERISMKTKYDFYKFLVISFEVCNVPLTFTTLINFFFHDKLNKFVNIYVDHKVKSKQIDKHIFLIIYLLNWQNLAMKSNIVILYIECF